MVGTRKHVRDGDGVETTRWAIAKDIQQKDLDDAMPTSSWGLDAGGSIVRPKNLSFRQPTPKTCRY